MFRLIEDAAEIYIAALTHYRPVKVYALVSGGKDSTAAAHLINNCHPGPDAIAHINTGIGIEETREYVRSTFAPWLGLPLIEKHPPRSYEDLVLEYGFPGPAAHRFMYSWLKERPLRELRREAQQSRNDRVAVVTGVRLTESRRRMGHVEPVQADGNLIWIAPIVNFEARDVLDYHDLAGIPKNEVPEILHMSGECLCGAFASPGELDCIARFYPGTGKRIRRLERRVQAAGIASHHWGPQSSAAIREANRSPGMLCQSCEVRE